MWKSIQILTILLFCLFIGFLFTLPTCLSKNTSSSTKNLPKTLSKELQQNIDELAAYHQTKRDLWNQQEQLAINSLLHSTQSHIPEEETEILLATAFLKSIRKTLLLCSYPKEDFDFEDKHPSENATFFVILFGDEIFIIDILVLDSTLSNLSLFQGMFKVTISLSIRPVTAHPKQNLTISDANKKSIQHIKDIHFYIDPDHDIDNIDYATCRTLRQFPDGKIFVEHLKAGRIDNETLLDVIQIKDPKRRERIDELYRE